MQNHPVECEQPAENVDAMYSSKQVEHGRMRISVRIDALPGKFKHGGELADEKRQAECGGREKAAAVRGGAAECERPPGGLQPCTGSEQHCRADPKQLGDGDRLP